MPETDLSRDEITLRSVAAHVFVADLDTPSYSQEDAHHVERVLRLRSDDKITICDGAGRWRVAAASLKAESFGPIRAISTPKPALRVGFALLKGDRNEWVVQKLTELGVDVITPLITSRTVVKWDGDRAHRNHERLRRVAREAAMQSRRAWLPRLGAAMSIAELASQTSVALVEPGGAPPSLAHATVLIGPEGGWGPDELALEVARVGLGSGILRADTAAVAIATYLTGLRSGLIRPAS